MATTESALRTPAKGDVNRAGALTGFLTTLALSLFAFLIHGYHPNAEDGGVYLAGVKKVLDPSLYPQWGEFVTAHLRFSLFAPMMVALVRLSHIGLMPLMLLVHLVCLWGTLHACWLIARYVTPSPEGRFGATLFVALLMTMPVAGTSLILVDPYVTARSISTPCTLLALTCVLRLISEIDQNNAITFGNLALGLIALLIAAAVHPLMAAYGFACMLLLLSAALDGRRTRLAIALLLCATAIATAAVLQHFSPIHSASYAAVAQTRTYWFLENWQWYELLGLAAPLLLLFVCWRRTRIGSLRDRLAHMAVAAGLTAILIAILFARLRAGSYMVAKLQPLRIFQTIYVLMLLALGALAGEHILKRVPWRWALATALLGGSMFWVQLETYPGSSHLELPWPHPHNQWEQGFQWIRNNTPKDAVFAMDAEYVYIPGEDAQNFRSTAERGALADVAKDGGVASIAPDLTQLWMKGTHAQKDLNARWTPARVPELQSLSASWVILSRSTKADLACPYTNEQIKICRLPQLASEAQRR